MVRQCPGARNGRGNAGQRAVAGVKAGRRDTSVRKSGSANPASNERFVVQARAQGDDVELEDVDGTGHFDVVMPAGPAAERVQRAIRDLLCAQ